jgi:hypothetical protein
MAHPNARITNSLSGAQYIGGTSATTGQWSAIQAVTDTKFHTLTGNVTGLANTALGSAIEVPAGLTIFGYFTAIQLHSGSVIAYNK